MIKYYDERFYLSGEKEALNIIYQIRDKHKEVIENNEKYFKNEIEEYNEFISRVYEMFSKFLTSDNIKNSILLSYMIRYGIFSISKDFEYNTELANEVDGFLGMNVLYGSGCCRNISSFFEDVFDKFDLNFKKFYCTVHYSKFNFGFTQQANHVINLIKTDDNVYGFDAQGIMLLHSISRKQLKSLSEYNPIYLRYKPYYEVIRSESDFEDIRSGYMRFEEESKKQGISIYEYENLMIDMKAYLLREREFLMDFKEDTMELKNDIYNGVKNKIKKLNI